MVVNYPKTVAVVFGQHAATAAVAATIQVGSNSVAVRPHFKYVGSARADGGQAFMSYLLSLCFPPGAWGWVPSSCPSPGVAPTLDCTVYGAAESWALNGDTGGTAGDHPQWLPEADIGPLPWHGTACTAPLSCWPPTASMATTGQHG